MVSKDYTKVFKDGVCVCVHVGSWDGSMLLNPEDLGLTRENVADPYELGKKLLVPKERIQRFRHIEGRARNCVDKASFVFPIGNSKFVPRRMFGEVLSRLQELAAEYNAAADQFVADFPTLKEQMIPIYREAAEQAFETMNPAVMEFGIEGDLDAKRAKRDTDKAEFIGKFLERINASYPSIERLRGRFYISWDTYQTSAPEMNLTTAEDVLQTTEVQAAAAEEAHRQMAEKINSFVSDVVVSLRAETSELCKRVATAVKSGKVVRSSTINSLKNHIERFKDMNFVGDQLVQDQLDAVKKELLDLNPTESFSTDENLRTELATRLAAIAESAEKVTELDVGSVTSQYRRVINWQ